MATRRLERVERAREVAAKAADADAPFTLDEVKALVKVLEDTDVTSLRLDRNSHRIEIRRAVPAAVTHVQVAPVAPATVVHPVAQGAVEAPAAPPLVAVPVPESKPGTIVTSPFVGTFYRSPSPESPVFVEVGSVVQKGQPLCIVEAMKLMNEIEAELSGRVAEILVQNATPVEYGQPLFRIEPA